MFFLLGRGHDLRFGGTLCLEVEIVGTVRTIGGGTAVNGSNSGRVCRAAVFFFAAVCRALSTTIPLFLRGGSTASIIIPEDISILSAATIDAEAIVAVAVSTVIMLVVILLHMKLHILYGIFLFSQNSYFLRSLVDLISKLTPH